MVIGLAIAALVVLLLLVPKAAPSQRATVDELASARMVALARLRVYEDERQERFRASHRAWSAGGGRRAAGHGYVRPFAAEAEERFHALHRAWSVGRRRSEAGRGYVAEFHAGAARG